MCQWINQLFYLDYVLLLEIKFDAFTKHTYNQIQSYVKENMSVLDD